VKRRSADRRANLEAAGISAADVDDLLDAIAAVVEPIRISYLRNGRLARTDHLTVKVRCQSDGAVITVTRRRGAGREEMVTSASRPMRATLLRFGIVSRTEEWSWLERTP
jgi:hypothetical protein